MCRGSGLTALLERATTAGRAAGALTHLHRVHSYVNAALQQRVVNLLCEQALAANVCQGLVQNLVAGRFDYAYLERALLVQLRKGRLGARAPQTCIRTGQAQVQETARAERRPTFSRSLVMYACASAKGLPRVPILTVAFCTSLFCTSTAAAAYTRACRLPRLCEAAAALLLVGPDLQCSVSGKHAVSLHTFSCKFIKQLIPTCRSGYRTGSAPP